MKKLLVVLSLIAGTVLINCTSTKLYYYETDASTPSSEKCIIGLIDNQGGMLNIESIDGEKVDIGGLMTPNKSFVIKSGNHKIILSFSTTYRDVRSNMFGNNMSEIGVNNPNNTSVYPVTVHGYAGGLTVEGTFAPGIVYLVNPLKEGNTLYLDIYEGDKLDTYNLSNMDLNHFTKIYQNILENE
jgi:hypothetical protein